MEHLRYYLTEVWLGPRTKADGSGLRQTRQPTQATPTARAAILTGIVKESGMPLIIGKLMAPPPCLGQQEIPLGVV